MHNAKTPVLLAMSEPGWSKLQQRFLEVLSHEEHRTKSVTEICQLAGYSYKEAWYRALKDERFASVVQALGVKAKRPYGSLAEAKQRLLAVLQHEENRQKTLVEICRLAGYKTATCWLKALRDEQFVAEVEALGVATRRHRLASHLEVEPATDIEEELASDVWDIRRLKQNYPKHVAPTQFEVDFSWITNSLLREQVKCYFRLRLPRWRSTTFKSVIYHLKSVLTLLPPDVHVGTVQRSHVEALLPAMSQLSEYRAGRGLRETKIMFDYMATSPAWSGPRPPRFLIWEEDIPPRPEALPRPIPPDVLDQFDPLLEQAEQAMKEGQEPPIIAPICWDALLILRHTGMRFEDLAHLKAPDSHGKKGCLDQDSEGYWWVCIDHPTTKMGRDHRIPTRKADGVIDAIRRKPGADQAASRSL